MHIKISLLLVSLACLSCAYPLSIENKKQIVASKDVIDDLCLANPSSPFCALRPIKDPICSLYPSLCIIGRRDAEPKSPLIPIFDWDKVCELYPEACIDGELVIGKF
jgi:hypothetical protein